MANIYNSNNNTLVSGTSHDDSIDNYGAFCSIESGSGDDSIYSPNKWNNYNFFSCEQGNDYVYNFGEYSTITAGTGDDTVINKGWQASILAGDGNDEIVNCGLYGYHGDVSYCDKTSIYGGTGNNTVYNEGDNVLIVCGNGNNSISNVRHVYSSELQQGVYELGKNVTIRTGSGQDSIVNHGENAVIMTGSGNDNIFNDEYSVTITAGHGNDTINGYEYENSKEFFQYSFGDGNDVITGYDLTDTIRIKSGNIDNAKLDSDDVVIKIGSGSIRLQNSKGKKITVINSKGKEIKFTNNYKGDDNSTLPSGVSYNNNRTKLTVKSPFKGTVDLTNYDSKVVTVDASLNTNFLTIKGNANANIIKAGTGGSNLYGQKGNDTLQGGSGVDIFYYGNGQGNDVIVSYTSAKDKIKLTSGTVSSSKISGTDVVLNVGNGSIKVKNMAGKKITVVDSKGNETSKVYDDDNTSANEKTQQQVIKDFMAVLDKTNLKGNAAVSSAINVSSNGLYSDLNDLVNHMCSDIEFSNNAIIFLNDYCGMSSGSLEDTGSITGKNVGSSKVSKGFADMVPENGALIKLDEIKSNSTLALLKDVKREGNRLLFTKKGLTVEIPNYYKNSTSFETKMSSQELTIINGLYTWWIEGALNLVGESYGSNFGFTNKSSATVQKIVYTDKHKSNNSDIRASVWTNNNLKSKATSLELWINLSKYSNIGKLSDKNGVSNAGAKYGEDYLDVTLAHELTHGTMAANINYFGNLPKFIKEGMAELTTGTISFYPTQIIRDYKNSSDKNSTELITTLKNDKFNDPASPYKIGYMFLRYFAKQVAENTLPSGLSYMNAKTKLLATSAFKGKTIDLANYSTVKDIDVSKVKHSITLKGNAKSNIIMAGTNGSNIYGGKGADTLYGGSGVDVFNYADGDGKDVIVNYIAGKDKIKLTSGEISNSKVSGTDIILNIGNGSIKIKNSAGKKITVIDSNGNETAKVYGTSRKISSLWFADEEANFSTSPAHIDSITNSGFSDYSLGNVDTVTDWTTLTPKDSLTSELTYSEK